MLRPIATSVRYSCPLPLHAVGCECALASMNNHSRPATCEGPDRSGQPPADTRDLNDGNCRIVQVEHPSGSRVLEPFEQQFSRSLSDRFVAGKRPLTGHQLSEFGLLGRLERVIFLDTKVSDCALELPQLSCTCKRVKSHARSLLSIAMLNIANSRALDDICSHVRIA